MSRRVLLVDDDSGVRDALGQTLELADLEPVTAASFVVAKDHISRDFDGVIVTDIRMPGRDGFHLLEYATRLDPELPVILLTGEGDVPMAVQAMQAGAHAFLEKPCAPSDLLDVVRKALGARNEVLEARRRRLTIESGDAAARLLFGVSDKADALRDRVRAVARSSGEVLVTGDPGSGTPKVAEVVHMLSAASRHPFVKRAGGALDPAGLDDAFAEAGAGSLYLDEVWALSSPAQFALLALLEDGRAARVIAGTTRDLEAEVRAGRFLADLYYRLDLLRVAIPALKDRTEDIPVMFRRYVAQACEQANLPEPPVTPDVIAGLMAREWPGNARALMSAAMRFAMGVQEAAEDGPDLGLADRVAQFERSLLIESLHASQGHATAAASALKLPRKTFYDKLTKHGIRPEDFRSDP